MVPMAMSSLLSSFIFNLLSLIHSATSSIQSFKQQARTGKSEGTLDLSSSFIFLAFAVYTIKAAREMNDVVFSSSCLVVREVLAGHTSSLAAL